LGQKKTFKSDQTKKNQLIGNSPKFHTEIKKGSICKER